MKEFYIDYSNTGYFSKSMNDLINSSKEIEEFIGHFSSLDSFSTKMEERAGFQLNRELLVERLQDQNRSLNLSLSSKKNIESLISEDSFTICSGHQLSLFTGHLYFIYKIASIIKLSSELKQNFPNKNFVPLFWLASEDHDFEEINNFKIDSKSFVWNTEQSGAVGRFSLEGLDEVYSEIESVLGDGEKSSYLKDLFKKTYLNHDNLSDATRYLVNELFGEFGIVILDGDDKILKSEMKTVFKRELLEQVSDKNISATNQRLESKSYKIQVGHREINLFYLKDNIRERIILDGQNYKVNNTNFLFSQAEILEELEKHPERFSPNSIMRPLYEENILPNLAYIGGGGELAYWMQLKQNFEDLNISYPILVLRNSLMYMNSNSFKKLNELGLSIEDIFLKEADLIKLKIDSLLEINFDEEYKKLDSLFDSIKSKQLKDKSLINSIEAHLHKQKDSLEKLEKKLKRAERKIYSDKINKLKRVKALLFPKNGLQERTNNFAELYLEFDKDIVNNIVDNISVLDNKFTILVND